MAEGQAGASLLPRYLGVALLVRVADEGARISLVLLALHATGNVALGGALVAALLIPHVVAAPLMGVAVDRARRPRWVLAAAFGVVAASLLATALLLGRVPVGVVVAMLVLGGCCGPAITGGLTSQLPALVGPDRTPRAFGLDSLFYNVASMAGPAVAGIAAAAVSPRFGQGLLAGCAALGAVGVATLPIRAGGSGNPERASLTSGVREIVRVRPLRVVTVTSALGQVGPGALGVVAAVLATSLHHPASAGLLLSAVAAGALVGSLLWTWRPLAAHRAPLVTTVSMIGVGVPLAVAAASPSIGLTAVLFGLSGVFIGPFGSALFTARTELADAAVRTQVFTIGAGLKVTASAAGAALVGFVTDQPVGVQLLLVASSPLLSGIVGTLLLVRVCGRSSTLRSLYREQGGEAAANRRMRKEQHVR